LELKEIWKPYYVGLKLCYFSIRHFGKPVVIDRDEWTVQVYMNPKDAPATKIQVAPPHVQFIFIGGFVGWAVLLIPWVVSASLLDVPEVVIAIVAAPWLPFFGVLYSYYACRNL
jgi:hypothetical protein